jgi:cytochrome c-type biogenesis protein CcmH
VIDMNRHRLLWIPILTLWLALSGAVFAQDTDEDVTDDDVNRVSRELYCPICENTPLDVCETQACEDWRLLIREKLEAGETDSEIVEYFADIYGDRARATPTTEGFSLIIWIAPVLIAVAAIVIFARFMRRWLARGAEIGTESALAAPSTSSDEAPLDPELGDYTARVEEELRRSA